MFIMSFENNRFFPQSLTSTEALFYPILSPTLPQHTFRFTQTEIFLSLSPTLPYPSHTHMWAHTHMYTYVHPCTLLQLHSQSRCFQDSVCKSYPSSRPSNASPFPKTVPNLHSTLLDTVKKKGSFYRTSIPKELVIFIDPHLKDNRAFHSTTSN